MRRKNAIDALAVMLTLAGGVHALTVTGDQTSALDPQKSSERLPIGPLPRAQTTAPGALTPKEIYHKLLPSTCWVVHEKRVGSEPVLTSGTGWVVDTRRRLIVTNHHVIDGVDVVGVVFPILKDGKVVNDESTYLKRAERITGWPPWSRRICHSTKATAAVRWSTIAASSSRWSKDTVRKHVWSV
jgi:hypothetical protein